MQIEKNIAATLRHRMEAEKKSKLEFSKELGIPRSTFQGYLKGENCLRSDSIEEIAKGLNITPAQLISGPEDAAAESLRLETLLPQIPTLHPQAQRLAKDAIALLQTAFRVSQELMCIDAHASEQDAPEGTYRYFLQETWQPARMRCSYGLLGQQRQRRADELRHEDGQRHRNANHKGDRARDALVVHQQMVDEHDLRKAGRRQHH